MINYTYGHLEGDEVLRDVSKRTLNSVRGTDIVARYGEEELIILLPQTNVDGATRRWFLGGLGHWRRGGGGGGS